MSDKQRTSPANFAYSKIIVHVSRQTLTKVYEVAEEVSLKKNDSLFFGGLSMFTGKDHLPNHSTKTQVTKTKIPEKNWY